MIIVIAKSLIVSLLTATFAYWTHSSLKIGVHLPDAAGFGAFVTAFSALYGIVTAFIVFEVWNKYNNTSELVDQEARGLEQLHHITAYFQDSKQLSSMEAAIKNYVKIVIDSHLRISDQGHRDKKSDEAFDQISNIIKNIKFDDDHDSVVFGHAISQYNQVSQIRTERINQSVSRLPSLLKAFLYMSSFLMAFSFIVMPFGNVFYSIIASAFLAFTISFLIQLVNDLDDPIGGHWSITTEPYQKIVFKR